MFLRNRGLLYNSVKLISTTTSKSSVLESTTKKLDYYKTVAANQEANDEVPAGWEEALPYQKIPGPNKFPIIGSMWKYIPGIGDYRGLEFKDLFAKLSKDYGKIACLRGPAWKKDMIFLFEPDDFERLHRNEGIWPIRPGLDSFAYYRNKNRRDVFQGVGGTLTTQGLEWFDFRSKVNPILMQPRTAHMYVKQLDEIAAEFIERMEILANANPKSEMPDNFISELNRWSFESIAVIALDRRFGCINPGAKPDAEIEQLISHVIKMIELMFKLNIGASFWKIYPTKDWKLYVKHMDCVTDLSIKYINEAYEKISKQRTEKSDHEISVFERLIKIDRRVAVAMTMDMLMAGVDTTSRFVATALYFLAKHKGAQENLRKELRQLLPKKESRVTKEVLADAPYLKAVIKEAFRVAPVSIGNMRRTNKNLVLAGYQIPKGSEVFTTNILVSNSEKYYPRPKEFLPERWLRTTSDELSHKTSHPFTYLPFGFGPRSCVGKRLANIEIEVVLAKIIRNFNLDWPHEDMKFKSLLIYGIASPLKLHVSRVNF